MQDSVTRSGTMQVRRKDALAAIAYGRSEVAGKDAGSMTDADRWAQDLLRVECMIPAQLMLCISKSHARSCVFGDMHPTDRVTLLTLWLLCLGCQSALLCAMTVGTVRSASRRGHGRGATRIEEAPHDQGPESSYPAACS